MRLVQARISPVVVVSILLTAGVVLLAGIRWTLPGWDCPVSNQVEAIDPAVLMIPVLSIPILNLHP
jgi:hypothetical protein